LLTAAYSLRGDYRLKVGELGDGPYLSGFNGDEAGAPRYRWTGSPRLGKDNPAVGVVTLPLAANPNANNLLRLTIGAADNPPLVTVTVNGSVVGTVQAEPKAFKTVEFAIPPEATGGDNTRVEISSPAFKPPNDSRYLGVQVAEVQLLSSPGFRRPPWDAALWAWLYTLAVGTLLLRLVGSERLVWSAGAGTAGLLPWLILPLALPGGLNLWYTPFYLPILAIAALVITVLVWREEVGNMLGRFLVRLETEESLARNIWVVALGLYTLYALFIVARMDFIGHADYADNAVAARNIVQGKGYSLDYAAQFYFQYTLPRPADTWPPLQPFMTVPFFVVFGPTTWAAKLPNLLLLPAFSWAVFYYGSRFFNRRAGLGAALLLPVALVPAFSNSPAFFETVAYPINDLGFSLLAFLFFASLGTKVWNPSPNKGHIPAAQEIERAIVVKGVSTESAPTGQAEISSEPEPKAIIAPEIEAKEETNETATISDPQSSSSPVPASSLIPHPSILRNPWLLTGLWSGLLFLSKPTGVIFLVISGLWLLGRKYIGPRKISLPWRDLLVWGGVALLVVSPFLVRNVLQFGTLYRSTEQYDAWVTKWNPPDEQIYDLFTPFSNQQLPQPRQLLEYGWDSNLNAINNQFKKLFNQLLDGQLVPPLLLMLAVVGIAVLPRRRYGLAALLGLNLLVYVLLFSVLWHYEPRYYLVWLPWIYLIGLYGLSWLCDRITSSNPGDERPRVAPYPSNAGYWIVGLAFLILAVPGINALITEGPGYTTPTGIVTTANWIKQNTPSDAVIMSRNVWELSFHSERKSVMTPNGVSANQLDQVKDVMRRYGVSYLELDHLEPDDRDINRQWGQRAAFWPLLDRQGGKAKGYEGFKLVYDKGGLLVYQWDGK
jgi:hypothetical protein